MTDMMHSRRSSAGGITIDAPLLSLRIVHLHRLPAAVPAAGSCSNIAAGNICDESCRLDSCSVVKLSISIASRIRVGGTIVVVTQDVSHGEWKFVWKKNKKRFDRCNRMGYKGIIN